MTRTCLRGVIAAIVTPVTAALDPDAPRFLRHARQLLAEGADGLNVLGTTGEATSFSLAQRRGLMEAAAAGLPRDRLMAGTGAAATRDAVDLTRHAGDCGFAGALVLPPFYYNGVGTEGILRYFDAIVEGSAGSGIPLYLYNFPALSGVPYTEELVSALVVRFGGRIAGLKDSSGDIGYARRIAALPGGLDVFPSSEAVLDQARAGGPFAGCISATVNVSARHAAAALHDGDDAALQRATAIRALFDGKPLVPWLKQAVAARMGDPGYGPVLPPFVPPDPAAVATLVGALEQIDKAPARP